jgi:hypothetical protein
MANGSEALWQGLGALISRQTGQLVLDILFCWAGSVKESKLIRGPVNRTFCLITAQAVLGVMCSN